MIEQVKVLSSAKRVNFKKPELFGKSFMEIKNNTESSIDPCGTPHSISRRSEILSLKDTYFGLLDKYHTLKLNFEEGPYGLHSQMVKEKANLKSVKLWYEVFIHST